MKELRNGTTIWSSPFAPAELHRLAASIVASASGTSKITSEILNIFVESRVANTSNKHFCIQPCQGDHAWPPLLFSWRSQVERVRAWANELLLEKVGPSLGWPSLRGGDGWGAGLSLGKSTFHSKGGQVHQVLEGHSSIGRDGFWMVAKFFSNVVNTFKKTEFCASPRL